MKKQIQIQANRIAQSEKILRNESSTEEQKIKAETVISMIVKAYSSNPDGLMKLMIAAEAILQDNL